MHSIACAGRSLNGLKQMTHLFVKAAASEQVVSSVTTDAAASGGVAGTAGSGAGTGANDAGGAGTAGGGAGTAGGCSGAGAGPKDDVALALACLRAIALALFTAILF